MAKTIGQMPREKLLESGAESLSDEELLAIFFYAQGLKAHPC